MPVIVVFSNRVQRRHLEIPVRSSGGVVGPVIKGAGFGAPTPLHL